MRRKTRKIPLGRCFDTNLKVEKTAYIAPTAVLKGKVTIGKRSSVWFNAVLRGDMEDVTIGDETNIQDGVIIHVDEGMAAKVGDRVTVGHGAIIHGATVEDDVIVGIGAILLNRSRVGKGAVIAAGSVVKEGFNVPAGTIAAGIPAKVIGKVSKDLKERIRGSYMSYLKYTDMYRKGIMGT